MAYRLRILSPSEAQATILRRRGLEDMDIPPAMAARLRDVFGEPLTPAQAVERIIAAVRREGDAAVRRFSQAFDGIAVAQLELSHDEVQAAYARVPAPVVEAMRIAAERVERYHRQQVRRSWLDFQSGLGQIVRPLERVGLYAPGGRAAYPSSVIMSAVPARVAGVDEIVLCTPPQRDGQPHPAIVVAADIAGVRRIFRIGGAQAIAALAHGTESVPPVDKILGPGNLFVVLAKRAVYGQTGIDQLPGPTETLIIADESADPAEVACDMLAQAEHDPMASAIALVTSHRLAEQVRQALEEQLAPLERREIAAQALEANGGIVVVESLDQALELANAYAPEHLCLLVRDPWALVGRVRHAGGVFLGSHSPEVMGDYVAGPSHIMPTGGTARFSSPLSVDDFIKTISVVALRPEDMHRYGPAAAELARAEGLTAHAAAVERRQRRGG
jgi:histidinol dehydrogenase